MGSGKRRKRRIQEETDERSIRMRESRARRKRAVKRMRRSLLILVLLILAVLVVFISSHKKKQETEEAEKIAGVNYDGQGLMSVGEASALGSFFEEDETDSVSDGSVTEQVQAVKAEGIYEGMVDINTLIDPGAALDVTSGQAAVDLTEVDRASRVISAKAAMRNMSFFTGCRKTVDSCLRSYGEGEWYGIRDVTEELRIFYDGIHREEQSYIGGEDNEEHTIMTEVPFKVVFTVFEDGSFVVRQITEDGDNVDDLRGWLERLV